jgi:hypothetical protein
MKTLIVFLVSVILSSSVFARVEDRATFNCHVSSGLDHLDEQISPSFTIISNSNSDEVYKIINSDGIFQVEKNVTYSGTSYEIGLKSDDYDFENVRPATFQTIQEVKVKDQYYGSTSYSTYEVELRSCFDRRGVRIYNQPTNYMKRGCSMMTQRYGKATSTMKNVTINYTCDLVSYKSH